MDPDQILSAQRAYVYLAEVGTPAPADVTTAPAAAWINVGLTTPDSLSFSTEPQFETVQSHQSDYETRRIQSSESAALAVDLQQWNGTNLKSVFGGGTITEVVPASGTFKYVPPAIGTRKEKACMVEIVDGARKYRWIFPRTLQVEGVQLELHKGQNTNLALRLAVLGGDDTDAWYVLSNDESLQVTP